jgi:hypothetical protein
VNNSSITVSSGGNTTPGDETITETVKTRTSKASALGFRCTDPAAFFPRPSQPARPQKIPFAQNLREQLSQEP